MAVRAKKKKKNFLRQLEKIGISLPERTLRRWRSNKDLTGAVYKSEKDSGKPATFLDDQLLLIVGNILALNLDRKQVGLREVQNLFLEHFGKTVSPAFVSKFLKKEGFSSKTAGINKPGYQLQVKDVVASFRSFIDQVRQDKVFDHPSHSICSVDFTFTSHRTSAQKSFVVREG